MPFLRAIQRSRNAFQSLSEPTVADSCLSADPSSSTAASSVDAEKSVSLGMVYGIFPSISQNAVTRREAKTDEFRRSEQNASMLCFAKDDKSELRFSVTPDGYAETAAAFAFFACSARCANPAASFTAKSARILRSSSTPAFFNPLMNWL